jgi:hypothetical protein
MFSLAGFSVDAQERWVATIVGTPVVYILTQCSRYRFTLTTSTLNLGG